MLFRRLGSFQIWTHHISRDHHISREKMARNSNFRWREPVAGVTWPVVGVGGGCRWPVSGATWLVAGVGGRTTWLAAVSVATRRHMTTSWWALCWMTEPRVACMVGIHDLLCRRYLRREIETRTDLYIEMKESSYTKPLGQGVDQQRNAGRTDHLSGAHDHARHDQEGWSRYPSPAPSVAHVQGRRCWTEYPGRGGARIAP